MGIFDIFKKKAKKTKEEIIKYQEAIAFAEEGSHEEAKRVMEQSVPLSDSSPVLLVVGNGSSFGKDVIEYSLDMAKKFNYKILALNAAPIGDDLPVKSDERRKLRDEFMEECSRSVASFKELAQKSGVEFQHVIKFANKDDALEEIKSEVLGIEFVISDSERDFVPCRSENREINRPSVCVYSMV